MGMDFAFQRRAAAALLILIMVAFSSAKASASETVLHVLPPATHAVPFGVSGDGTVWLGISHGLESPAPESGVIGKFDLGGAFTEISAPALERSSVGPFGEVWAVEGNGYPARSGPLNLNRFAASGEPAGVYQAGQIKGNVYPEIGGPRGVPAIVVTDDAVWFARDRGLTARSSIERLSTVDGTISQHFLPPGFQPTDLAVTPGGTAWFIETDSGLAYVTRLEPDGQARRLNLREAPTEPVSLAIGSSGAVWVGAYTRTGHGFRTQFGQVTNGRGLKLFDAPRADAAPIAVGPEGRLWFEQALGRAYYSRALNSIGVGGDLGSPVCGDPRCFLEVDGLVGAGDGSFWYGLSRPNQNHGGGGSGLGIDIEISNEAGLIGQFRP